MTIAVVSAIVGSIASKAIDLIAEAAKKAKDPRAARQTRKEVLANKGSRWHGFPAVHHLTRKESEMKTAIIAFTVSFIVSTVIYRTNRRKKNGGK